MVLTKLQPFGLKCWVYQKKPIRDRQYAGKSDKKERSREGILVGYSDSRGPLHGKVYFPNLKQSEWYPEELVRDGAGIQETSCTGYGGETSQVLLSSGRNSSH